MFKSTKAALVAVFLCLSLVGCSVMETLGDYLNENPVFTSMATRQAVGRYIAAGKTVEEERERAADVQRRISKVMHYVDGNPTTSIDTLLAIIDSNIEWEKLEPVDRLLVQDVVMLVEVELRKYESEANVLSDTTSIAIKALFQTAISAAQIYLSK